MNIKIHICIVYGKFTVVLMAAEASLSVSYFLGLSRKIGFAYSDANLK